ncbi:MAG: class I SAM-dependent methyltransferase [Actinomycetota bacterium]|nr:class I SAM-dependent methyltransferase [Actinomycetota bacterium]
MGGTYDLGAAYQAKDSAEAEAVYDEGADEYERRILGWGYSTPAVIAYFLGRFVAPGDGPILDAGAGTGLMGLLLSTLGHGDVIGIDLSERMLAQASEKGVYRSLHRMDLAEPLDLPADEFAATVASGVFAAGHAPPAALPELVRVTRPGGHVIFSVRTDVYADGTFKQQQEELERERWWELAQASEPFAHLRLEYPELKVQVFDYRVL